MDPLLQELTRSGVLDTAAAEWARTYQATRGDTLDTALLELDLIDEEGLLSALESCTGLKAATAAEVERAMPELQERLPEDFSVWRRWCPVRVTGNALVVMVTEPLGDNIVAGLEALGFDVTQLAAPAHYVRLVRSRVYGVPTDRRAAMLEARLARRRRAADADEALDQLEGASTLGESVRGVLDFAEARLQFSCFLVASETELRIAATRGGDQRPGTVLPLPEAGSSLGAAVRYGGYFVGPPTGTDDDRHFYRALGRALPRWALVAPVPVPVAGKRRMVFYADNGPRGMAARWIAELALLVSRVGQHAAKARQGPDNRATSEPTDEQVPHTEHSPEPPPPRPEDDAAAAPTAQDQAALDRLRAAAAQAGQPFDAFVDRLLREHHERAAAASSTALADEVKGLFEKLATDIPTQLARGMESALRNMAVRRSSRPPPAPVSAGPAATPDVEIVQKDTATREVPSYRSRRRRAKIVKL